MYALGHSLLQIDRDETGLRRAKGRCPSALPTRVPLDPVGRSDTLDARRFHVLRLATDDWPTHQTSRDNHPMHVRCACPACEQPVLDHLPSEGGELRCAQCGWQRPVPKELIVDDAPVRCLVCDSPDLWRQKDFPQSVGVLCVAAGAILSSIAWYYHEPVWALGILMAFAAADMVLFVVMPDVLVCYRCRARHGGVKLTHEHETYDHETGERYRQEAIRMRQP